MPASEEFRLTTLLWQASRDAKRPLTQQEIDAILEVQQKSDAPAIPQQRQDPDSDAWHRIRTDAGDQRWLNHLSEPHCWEFF